MSDARGKPGARAGRITEVPFERLLLDAFLAERTCALELRRRQIKKTVFLSGGAPVECTSNLRHETLGQFLLGRERITNAEFKDCQMEAAARQVRMGDVLVERGLVAPHELGDALRQNLAFKLLDCFTWSDGEYRIEPWMPEPGDVPVVEPTRVLFTGISKFVPQERVMAALGPLLAHPLVVAERSRIDPGKLRMSENQALLLRKLRSPTEAHALFADDAVSRDELARTLYACTLMGLVVPAEGGAPLAPRPEPEAGEIVEAEPEPEILIEVDTSDLDESEPWELRDAIAAEYRELSGRDPVVLYALPDDPAPEAVRSRYRELCRRYAPDRFEDGPLAPLAEIAAELLHATTLGYETLRGRANVPAFDIADEAEPPSPEPEAEPDPLAISPEPRRLAGEYARQARERMASGNFAAGTGLLTLALRSDPTNRTCRIELAYARFREAPERALESLEEIEGLVKAMPDNVLARLYAAEMSHAVEAFDRAAAHFREACALWERERS